MAKAAAEEKKNPIKITDHVLVPKHEVLSEKEKKELIESYNISIIELPKILASDPAIKGLNLKEGDVVKVTRKSPSAGETVFYRGVISE